MPDSYNSRAASTDTILVNGQPVRPYHHQQRPYPVGQKGDPYVVNKRALLYEDQQGQAKTSWRILEKRRLEQRLHKAFPKIYVLTHAFSLLLLGVIQIGLQIALLCTNGALAWVASGIWGGAYFVILALFTIALVKKRTYCLYVTVYLLHALGIFMAIGAFLVVNIIAIGEYTEFCSYYPKCFNVDVKPLNYIAFFLGVIAIIMLLIYLIVMPCYLMDLYSQLWKYRQKKEEKVQRPNEILKHGVLYEQKPVPPPMPMPMPVPQPSITTVPSFSSHDSSRRYNPSLAGTRIVECNSVTKFPTHGARPSQCSAKMSQAGAAGSFTSLNTASASRDPRDPVYRETTRTYQSTEEFGTYPVYTNASYIN